MSDLPKHKTAHELEVILADALGKLLANHIAADAFDRRFLNPDSIAWTRLTPADVIANVHLYERLQDATEALRALKSYLPEHRGYALVPG